MTMASSSMSTNATTTGMNTTASSATSMSSMSMAPMRVRQTDSESGSSQTMTSNSTATINPTCVNTTSKLYTLDFPSNATWMMFHLINAGASQHLAFSIDEHDMWVISADGAFVKPAKVQVSLAGRRSRSTRSGAHTLDHRNSYRTEIRRRHPEAVNPGASIYNARRHPGGADVPRHRCSPVCE